MFHARNLYTATARNIANRGKRYICALFFHSRPSKASFKSSKITPSRGSISLTSRDRCAFGKPRQSSTVCPSSANLTITTGEPAAACTVARHSLRSRFQPARKPKTNSSKAATAANHRTRSIFFMLELSRTSHSKTRAAQTVHNLPSAQSAARGVACALGKVK